MLQGLSTDDYRRVMKVVEEAILSTDLALYFRKKDLFLETANSGEIDWQENGKKQREFHKQTCGLALRGGGLNFLATAPRGG